MKKAFVFLFPQKEYMKHEFTYFELALLEKVILCRYVEKSFDFGIVNYRKREQFGFKLEPNFSVFVNSSLEEVNKNGSKATNFSDMANRIKEKGYSEIALGGLHCFDCVEKAAKAIEKAGMKVLIDVELTEKFTMCVENRGFKTKFVPEFYDPKLFFEFLVRYMKNFGISDKYKFIERFGATCWGVGEETITEMIENSTQR